MRRYALRDDQWERIKDILPGREGHVGVTATTAGYSRQYFTVIAQVHRRATCRNVLATRSRFMRGFRAGRRAARGALGEIRNALRFKADLTQLARR
jgi:transposase